MRIVRNAAIGLAAIALTWSGMAFGQSQSSDQSNQQSGQSGSDTGVQRPASPMGAEGGSSDISTPDSSVLGRGTRKDVQRSQQEQQQQGQQGQTGGFGQGSQGATQQGGQQKADKASQDFIKKVADSNSKEVEISRLAEQKAENPAVRDLARQMVRDHEQLSTKLQRVATDVGVTVPSAATGEDKEQKKLSKEQGTKFDKSYMSWLVDSHKKDVSTFEKEADKTNANPQIKTFASDSLPELRHHLMRAESVQQQIQSEGKSSKGQQGTEEQKGTSGETGGYGGSSGSQSGSSSSGSQSGSGSSGSQESGSSGSGGGGGR